MERRVTFFISLWTLKRRVSMNEILKHRLQPEQVKNPYFRCTYPTIQVSWARWYVSSFYFYFLFFIYNLEYKKYWHIKGLICNKSMLNMLESRQMSKNFNFTHISLVPEFKALKQITQYRLLIKLMYVLGLWWSWARLFYPSI